MGGWMVDLLFSTPVVDFLVWEKLPTKLGICCVGIMSVLSRGDTETISSLLFRTTYAAQSQAMLMFFFSLQIWKYYSRAVLRTYAHRFFQHVLRWNYELHSPDRWVMVSKQSFQRCGDAACINDPVIAIVINRKKWYQMILNRKGQLFLFLWSDVFSLCVAGVSFIGPSVTTFGNLNPGYRIYTVDGLYSNSTFVSTRMLLVCWKILSHRWTIFRPQNQPEDNKFTYPHQ